MLKATVGRRRTILDDLSSDSDDEYFDVVTLPGLRPPAPPHPSTKGPAPPPPHPHLPPTHSQSLPAVNKTLAKGKMGNTLAQATGLATNQSTVTKANNATERRAEAHSTAGKQNETNISASKTSLVSLSQPGDRLSIPHKKYHAPQPPKGPSDAQQDNASINSLPLSRDQQSVEPSNNLKRTVSSASQQIANDKVHVDSDRKVSSATLPGDIENYVDKASNKKPVENVKETSKPRRSLSFKKYPAPQPPGTSSRPSSIVLEDPEVLDGLATPSVITTHTSTTDKEESVKALKGEVPNSGNKPDVPQSNHNLPKQKASSTVTSNHVEHSEVATKTKNNSNTIITQVSTNQITGSISKQTSVGTCDGLKVRAGSPVPDKPTMKDIKAAPVVKGKLEIATTDGAATVKQDTPEQGKVSLQIKVPDINKDAKKNGSADSGADKLLKTKASSGKKDGKEESGKCETKLMNGFNGDISPEVVNADSDKSLDKTTSKVQKKDTGLTSKNNIGSEKGAPLANGSAELDKDKQKAKNSDSKETSKQRPSNDKTSSKKTDSLSNTDQKMYNGTNDEGKEIADNKEANKIKKKKPSQSKESNGDMGSERSSRSNSVTSDASRAVSPDVSQKLYKRTRSGKLAAVLNVFEEDTSQASEKSKPKPSTPKVGKITGLASMFEGGSPKSPKLDVNKLKSPYSGPFSPETNAPEPKVPNIGGISVAKFGNVAKFKKFAPGKKEDDDKGSSTTKKTELKKEENEKCTEKETIEKQAKTEDGDNSKKLASEKVESKKVEESSPKEQKENNTKQTTMGQTTAKEEPKILVNGDASLADSDVSTSEGKLKKRKKKAKTDDGTDTPPSKASPSTKKKLNGSLSGSAKKLNDSPSKDKTAVKPNTEKTGEIKSESGDKVPDSTNLPDAHVSNLQNKKDNDPVANDAIKAAEQMADKMETNKTEAIKIVVNKSNKENEPQAVAKMASIETEIHERKITACDTSVSVVEDKNAVVSPVYKTEAPEHKIGTGELKPTATENVLTTVTGDIKPTDTKEFKPTVTLELKPTDTKEIMTTDVKELKSTDIIELSTTITGEIKPIVAGETKTTDKIELNSTDTNELMTIVTGELKPTVTEELKPTVIGEIKPTVSGEIKTTDTKELKPLVTEELKTIVTGELKPTFIEEIKTTVTEELKPAGTEEPKTTVITEMKPTVTGELKPTVSGEIKTTDTKELKPAVTEELKTIDTKEMKPTVTGELNSAHTGDTTNESKTVSDVLTGGEIGNTESSAANKISDLVCNTAEARKDTSVRPKVFRNSAIKDRANNSKIAAEKAMVEANKMIALAQGKCTDTNAMSVINENTLLNASIRSAESTVPKVEVANVGNGKNPYLAETLISSSSKGIEPSNSEAVNIESIDQQNISTEVDKIKTICAEICSGDGSIKRKDSGFNSGLLSPNKSSDSVCGSLAETTTASVAGDKSPTPTYSRKTSEIRQKLNEVIERTSTVLPRLEFEVQALAREASTYLETGRAGRVSASPARHSLILRQATSSGTDEEEVFEDAIDPSQLDTLMPLPLVPVERELRSRSRTPLEGPERSPSSKCLVAQTEALLSETDRLLRRSRSDKSLRRSYTRSLSSAALEKSAQDVREAKFDLIASEMSSSLAEVTADLSEEHSTAHLAGERLEAEQAERMKLEKEVGRLQGSVRAMTTANGRLEEERLVLRSEVLNGDVHDDDDDEEHDASLYRRKYQWCLREMELLKKQLKQQQEDDYDHLLLLKKQLEKKVADAYEETEEQRQVVAQMKRKSQRLQAEMNDLKILLEEQTSRNNLLEKKQRKFDQDMLGAQEELRHERTNKDKIQREKDQILSEKYSFEQEVSTLKLELELKEEKVSSLSRELADLSFTGRAEEEVASLKKAKHDLELRVKDQEEELDDLAGQVQMLEGAKVRLEMSIEQMRKENRREASQREEELEEVRISAQKKVKALESQMESEHEERTHVVREKHELERRLAALQDRSVSHVEEEYVIKLKKELKKTKALLRDTQTMLEQTHSEGGHKLMLRQLKTQLEDAEFAKTAALKARQCAESDLTEMNNQLEEAQRARKEAEDRCARTSKDRAEIQTQLEESEEEVAEVMKKYKAVVSQLSVDQITLSEQSQQISELEHEKQVLQDRQVELSSKVEVLEGETANIHTQRRLEMKIKEVESKLELEQTTRQRLESQIGRLKDQLERLAGECDSARVKESQAVEQSRRVGRQLREVREDLSALQQKHTDAVSKKGEVEKQLELADSEVITLKSDLKLAFKRIEDLQQAIQGDLNDSDSDLSDSDSDSDGSLSSYLTASLKHQRSSSNSTLRTPPSEVQQLDRLDQAASPSSEGMSAISEDLEDGGPNRESFA